MSKIYRWYPLLIVLAAILWSLDGLLRRNLYTLPASTIVFYEHLFGAIVIFPFVFPQISKIKSLTKKEWGALLWVVILSGALGTIFYTAALTKINFIQFSVVVLLQQLQPIFAILAAAIVLKEKISSKFIFWAILALAAAYFVTFPHLTINLQTGAGTVVAALLAVGAAFAWGSSTAFSRYALLNSPFILITALRFWLTPIFALISVILLGQLKSLGSLSATQIYYLLGITFSTGLLALAIYYAGLKRTPARVSTILELFWPLSAVALGFFYFKEVLTPTQIIGSIVLLYSIYNVSAITKKDFV